MAELSTDEIAENCSLYQEFLAERDEILRHKWIKSEEAGRDIGFETALVDWSATHREKWKKDYLAKPRR
jgi:hypothetical protein